MGLRQGDVTAEVAAAVENSGAVIPPTRCTSRKRRERGWADLVRDV
jgi:hypothetical protein